MPANTPRPLGAAPERSPAARSRSLLSGLVAAGLCLAAVAAAQPAEPAADAPPPAAEERAPEAKVWTPETLQAALARGDFDKYTEDQLREALTGMDPVILVDAALLLLKQRPQYATILEKTERIRGDLQPVDTISVQYRRKPLAIFARYIAGPHETREILYDDTLRPGEMTVVEAGLMGFMTLNLDIHSSLTKRATNHNVTEMGLEFPLLTMRNEVKLLQQAGQGPDLTEGKLVVEGGKRYWEIAVTTDGPPRYYSANTRLRFEVNTALVSLMEIKDASGVLLERFAYRDTVFGTQPEDTWDVDNPAYRF